MRESVGHREQLRFFALIDVVDQEFARDDFNLEAVQSGLSRARSVARRELSDDWGAMARLLNGFDSLEQEAVRAFNQGQ